MSVLKSRMGLKKLALRNKNKKAMNNITTQPIVLALESAVNARKSTPKRGKKRGK